MAQLLAVLVTAAIVGFGFGLAYADIIKTKTKSLLERLHHRS